MINTKMKPFLHLALVALFILPAKSEALTTSAQHAFKLSNTQALFVVEYDFGSRRSDFYLPLLANTKKTNNNLTYAIERDGVVDDSIKSTAVILSPLSIKDNEYILPAGSSSKFTLVVIVETKPDDRDAEYRLNVAHLPYFFGPDRRPLTVHADLLKQYTPPSVELNLER
jgi:hypothetical protein